MIAGDDDRLRLSLNQYVLGLNRHSAREGGYDANTISTLRLRREQLIYVLVTN
jgi:hypothetical protein